MNKQPGKTVRIFMAEGKPSGLLVAEILNWTGQVYQFPRSKLTSLGDREELKKTGVYILIGPSETNPQKDKVYFGEADNVFHRVSQHERKEEKDFWNRAICIISKDENLTKSHVRYLESRLIEIAKDANRSEIENATAPNRKALPESEVADMEFFLDQVLLILPILGANFNKPRPEQETASEESPVFEYTQVGTKATAQEIDGDFVVFQGSTARKNGTPSWKSYKPLREQLLNEGKLIDSSDKDFYVFAENVAFASPSAAAAVVYAGNQNGRKQWKLKGTNKSYKEWQEELLNQN